MISRRAALQFGVLAGGVGIAGFVTQQVGVLDDGLRAVGLRPHAEPEPRDVLLLRDAGEGQRGLLRALDEMPQGNNPEIATIRAVFSEQLTAVSDEPAPTPTIALPTGTDPDFIAFAELVEAAAAARADGALAAGSLAVVKVLAAMSAGLEQVAVAARRLA